MDWKNFWDQFARSEDPHQQVARISKNDLPVDIVARITHYIMEQLEINENDHVLDVCCGNGVITKELANHCEHVTGVDLSPVQIENARETVPENVTLIEGDGLELSSLVPGQFDKALCYFSFQYFDTYRKGKQAIAEMAKVLKPGGKIFLGDVPDYDKRKAFYQTWDALLKNKIDRLLDRDAMGKFWQVEELDRICQESGLRGQYMKQPEGMLYSHYRFDYLITKNV